MPFSHLVPALLAIAGALLTVIAGSAAMANPTVHAGAAAMGPPATDPAGAMMLALLGVAFSIAALLTARLTRS
ncbi:hypothetical protein STVA_07600 [Allostella vacuolata]|nr:hypothetical protein STVA_07600 [Stella vacuolata]